MFFILSSNLYLLIEAFDPLILTVITDEEELLTFCYLFSMYLIPFCPSFLALLSSSVFSWFLVMRHFSSFPFYKVSNEKSADNLIEAPLYMMSHFSLDAFKSLLSFDSLTVSQCGSQVILVGVYQASWMLILMPFIRFGELSTILSSDTFLVSPSVLLSHAPYECPCWSASWYPHRSVGSIYFSSIFFLPIPQLDHFNHLFFKVVESFFCLLKSAFKSL